MITQETIEAMSEEELCGWVLRRVRGQEAAPPLSVHHLETPDDYIAVVHGRTTDLTFRERLERAILRSLAEAGAGDLRGGADANAAKNLAEVALRRRISGAAPVLQRIAESGALGGRTGHIEEGVERSVLFALAGLQARKSLWDPWQGLWNRGAPELWPIAIAGMRLSNSYKATSMLGQIVRRALGIARFPLGEVLWAFGTDPNIDAAQIAKALSGLNAKELDACRRELREIGALESEIDTWVPAAPPGALPAWAVRRHLPSRPPRMHKPSNEAEAA